MKGNKDSNLFFFSSLNNNDNKNMKVSVEVEDLQKKMKVLYELSADLQVAFHPLILRFLLFSSLSFSE